MQLKASAPGSLILLGEYAVLYGKPALVCAVDKRITVTLTPRDDKEIHIQSTLHGHHVTTVTDLTIEKPFHFVLGALKLHQSKLKRGCDIHIESNFSDKVGLGSSAAVTVATLATLVTWLDKRLSPLDLVRQGRQVVRSIQGVGSGADIAASVYGGIVGYQAQSLVVEKFSVTHPLVAWYAGFKTPTVEAIKQVQTQFAPYPELFRHLCQSIGQCAREGIQLVRREEWGKLGEIFNYQQGLMEALGVSMPLLHDTVEILRQQPEIKGAKISGSGLGDCVIGLGSLSNPSELNFLIEQKAMKVREPFSFIPVAMTLQGIQCEKI